jgi:hypothetical protein
MRTVPLELSNAQLIRNSQYLRSVEIGMFRVRLEGEGELMSSPDDIADASVSDYAGMRAASPDFIHQ